MQKKKWKALMLAVVLILTQIISSMAMDKPTPYYDYVGSAHASLSIPSGEAVCVAKVIAIPSKATGIEITMALQQYRNGWWITLEKWTESSTSMSCTATGSRYVDSGYTYRLKATCTVYGGDDSETFVQYSTDVEY